MSSMTSPSRENPWRSVQRDAPLRRPQHDAIDAGSTRHQSSAVREVACRCRRAPTASRRGSTCRRAARARRRIRHLLTAPAARPDRRCAPSRPRPTHATRRDASSSDIHAAQRSTNASRASSAASCPTRNSHRSSASARASAGDGLPDLAVTPDSSSSEETRRRLSRTASDHSCPPSNVERRAPPRRTARRRVSRVWNFVSVYHSSLVPRQTSAVRTRASAAASISGGTSPPTAMTPSTRRGGRGRGAERHRDALRERRRTPAARRARISRDRGVDHAVDVGEVVGDRQLAILPRHPARDHLVGAALVEAVQPLNRHQQPAVGAWNRAHPFELRFGAFAVAVEADEQTGAGPPRPAAQQIASVRGRSAMLRSITRSP